MFGSLSYVGYTLLFCVPPLLYMWLRGELRRILLGKLGSVLRATAILTLYGSFCWPIALELGAWAYAPDRVTGVELLGYVYLDDVLWWLLIGLDFSSFLVIAAHFRDRGEDVVLREARRLLRGVRGP